MEKDLKKKKAITVASVLTVISILTAIIANLAETKYWFKKDSEITRETQATERITEVSTEQIQTTIKESSAVTTTTSVTITTTDAITEDIQSDNQVSDDVDKNIIPLCDLKITDSKDFELITTDKGSKEDNIGNLYSAGNLFKSWTYGAAGGAASGAGFADFYLGSEYATLKGLCAVSDECSDSETRLEIYGDGKLIYSNKFKKKTTPFDVEIDVCNIEWLKIHVISTEGSGGVILLSDFELYKNNATNSSVSINDDKMVDNKAVLLSDLKVTDSKDFDLITMNDGAKEDNIGNIYSPGNLFKSWTYSAAGGAEWGAGFADFYIGSKYKTLKGICAVSDECSNSETNIEIYGDERLIYSNTFDNKTIPFDIEADVSDIEWLKIRIIAADGSGGVILISDFELH